MNDRLYRSIDDRVIAGVAGGLADRLGVDPAIVRIIWTLAILVSNGVFLVIYIVMALVVPEEDDLGSFSPMPPGGASGSGPAPGAATGLAGVPAAPVPGWVNQQGGLSAAQLRTQARAERRAARAARRAQEGPGRGGVVVGVVLIALGAWFLVREYLPQLDFDRIWPVIILVLGLALVAWSMGLGRDGGGRAAPPTGPGSGATGGRGSDATGGPADPGGAA